MSANGNGGSNGGGSGDGSSRVGANVITSPSDDTRTLNHRGTEVGTANINLQQNTVDSHTEILRWTIPEKYVRLVYAGGKHYTKAELRSLETFDGDGATTSFSTSMDLIAIAGEEDLDDQPFNTVVAYDTDAGSELEVDSIDYEADEVTFVDAPNTGTDNVKIWPVISDGVIQYRAYNAFDQQVGPLDEWGVPNHVFADFHQLENTTQIHLPGAGRFQSNEGLAMFLNASAQVVWTDDDYPRGDYVSSVEQRVDVSV